MKWIYTKFVGMASTGQARIIKTLKLEHLNQHMKLIGRKSQSEIVRYKRN